jgi:hypothetical protein
MLAHGEPAQLVVEIAALLADLAPLRERSTSAASRPIRSTCRKRSGASAMAYPRALNITFSDIQSARLESESLALAGLR